MEKHLIRPPILIDESGDVEVFDSIEAAESYLEPIDVERERFVGYDSEGRLLRLFPTSPRVTIAAAEPDPSHSDKLHIVLSEYLQRVGIPSEWIKQASLGELVEKSAEYKVQSTSPLEQIRSFFRRLLSRHSS